MTNTNPITATKKALQKARKLRDYIELNRAHWPAKILESHLAELAELDAKALALYATI